MIRNASIVLMTLGMTACSGIATMNKDFVMAGSADGIHAFADTITGVIKEGKQGADTPSQFFALRATQERERTTRDTAPGFLDALFVKTEESGS